MRSDRDSMVSELFDLASSRNDLCSDLDYGPVSPSTVSKVEAALEAKLPGDFRSYLLHFAGGRFLGWEFFGVPTEKSKLPCYDGIDPSGDGGNLILDIIRQRQIYGEGLPVHLIPIATDGGDCTFFLDTSTMSESRECPVVMYGLGAEGVVIARSFFDLLKRLAQDELE